MNKVQIACEYCGNLHERTKWSIKRAKHHFCSRKCVDAYAVETKRYTGENNPNWQEKLTLKCANCLKEFSRLECNSRNRKNFFCSQKCTCEWKSKNVRGESHPLHKRIIMVCEWCSREYETIPFDLGKRRFCSGQCHSSWFLEWVSTVRVKEAHPNWKGGATSYRAPNWPIQSELARRRDNYKCQRCQSDSELNVHHIKAFRLFGIERYLEANDLGNLITLCKSCHSIVEWETNRDVQHD